VKSIPCLQCVRAIAISFSPEIKAKTKIIYSMDRIDDYNIE